MKKYAICNELYEGWELPALCEHATQHGYRGLEIAPFTLGVSPTQLIPQERMDLRKTIRANGMEVVGLHWLLAKTEGFCLTSNDHEIQSATAHYLADLAELCADLGGSLMVLGSPQQRNFPDTMDYAQAESNAVAVLKQLAPHLAQHQVTLALEPLGPEEGNFMLTAESAIEIIDQVQSDFIRLHLDVKAMSTESKPIPEIIRDSAQHLAHFHANDPNRQGPGMGEVEYGPIFEALSDIGYEGWLSVEVFDYAPGVDALVGESIRYMKSFE